VSSIEKLLLPASLCALTHVLMQISEASSLFSAVAKASIGNPPSENSPVHLPKHRKTSSARLRGVPNNMGKQMHMDEQRPKKPNGKI